MARIATDCGVDVRMDSGGLLVLEAGDLPAQVTVMRGVAWLTTTPAAGDELLSEGAVLTCRAGAPVVVEALCPRTWIRVGKPPMLPAGWVETEERQPALR